MTVYMIRRKSDGLFSTGTHLTYLQQFAPFGGNCKVWFNRRDAERCYTRLTTPGPSAYGHRDGEWAGLVEVVEFNLVEG